MGVCINLVNVPRNKIVSLSGQVEWHVWMSHHLAFGSLRLAERFHPLAIGPVEPNSDPGPGPRQPVPVCLGFLLF